MSKSAKKRPAAKSASDKSPKRTGTVAKPKDTDSGSKQARVIAMLRSSTGVTLDAIMKATGWQQHSVRGFLAGVVRKRLKLKLESKKMDGNRVYQVTSNSAGKASSTRQPNSRAA